MSSDLKSGGNIKPDPFRMLIAIGEGIFLCLVRRLLFDAAKAFSPLAPRRYQIGSPGFSAPELFIAQWLQR